MLKKSNKKLIIILIVFLIIVIGATITALFFLKGTFKSNKEMFISELMQFAGQKEVNSNGLEEYFNKKQNTLYENNGSFKVDMQMSDDNNIKVPTIEFSGKTDPTKEKAEQNIEIKYSDDVVFPINYMHDEEIYGLQTKYVSKKYIAIENDNLQDFISKLGVTNVSNDIPDKIEIPRIDENNKFTNEEIAQLMENFKPILDNIKEEQIVVTTTQNGKECKLTLTTQQIKDILVQFLDICQKDNVILSKINSLFADNSDDIITALKDLQEQLQETEETEEGNINIVLITEKDNTAKLEIQMPNDVDLSLQKVENQDKISYQFSITLQQNEQNVEITFLSEFNGIQTQEVTEHYVIGFTVGEQLIEYDFENRVNFVDSLEIGDLNEDTAMILNNYSQEKIMTLMQAIVERIAQVNKDQMETLGLSENDNPLQYIFFPLVSELNVMQSTKTDISEYSEQDVEIE